MPVQIMVSNTPQKAVIFPIKPHETHSENIFEYSQLSIIVHLPDTYMTGITSVL